MAVALALDQEFRDDVLDGGCIVEHGDAYDLIPGLPAASIDLVVTSPPLIGATVRIPWRTTGRS